MFADEIATLLEQLEVGTVFDGSSGDIFITLLPFDEAVSGLYIVASTADEPDKYVETQYAMVEFFAAAPSPLDAYNRLMSIKKHLHRRGNYDLTNFEVYFSHAVTDVEDMDRDQEGRSLQRLSMRFVYRDLNIIS